jgi:hypothetical protein
MFSQPLTINQTIDGLMFSLDDDNEYKQNVTINIDGVYTKHIFGEDVFTGDIYINDSKINTTLDRQLIIKLDNNRGMIGKTYINKKTNTEIYIGEIFITSNFQKICMLIMESDNDNSSSQVLSWSWSESDGILISGPATDKEIARNIADELMSQK